VAGATAYATDNPTAPFGIYTSGGWQWYATGTTSLPTDGWISDTNTWAHYSRTQAYTNDPAAGTGITLNMTNTSDFIVGSDVTVSSSAGSENTYVTAVVANTSITVNQLFYNHTTSSPLVTLLDVFRINADVSATIKKTAKVKFTQTTVKYGTVLSSTYTGGYTYIVMIHNTDYTLTTGAMSSTYYSYSFAPSGFPTSFNFDPAPLGFSSLPSTIQGIYYVFGGVLFLRIAVYTGGTSNATTFTTSGPCVATSFVSAINILIRDNGADITDRPTRTILTVSARTVTHRTDMLNGAWTAASTKWCAPGLLLMEY
jgi:hypothetical protein